MKSPDAQAGRRGAAAADRRPRRVVQRRKPALLARLNRIEGQVRGVASMIEQDRYCVDVLTQISAIQSALDGAAMQLLRDHTQGCVQAAIKSGRGKQAIEELIQVVHQFVR